MQSVRKRHIFDKEILDQLIKLRSLDNWHGIVALFYDYGVIALAIALSITQPLFYPLSIIVIGSRQRALATLLHEAAHQCLVKSVKLNKLIATYFSGYLIFQEYSLYHDSHIKSHHAYLGDEERDPDYSYHIKEKLYEKQAKHRFVNKYILGPVLLLKTPSYLLYLLKNRMTPKRKYLRNFIKMYVYWLFLIAIFAYFGQIKVLVMYWFVPLFTTAAIVGWFNELAEHYPLMQGKGIDVFMSRNRFSHWLEHFIFNTHQENYHLVHHLQPRIPFWNLKKANEVMSQDPVYNKLNKKSGGIFVSNNGNPSLIRWLLQSM